jgi:hypothetical protein
MRADYDSQADAIAITLDEPRGRPRGDEVHERAIVAVVGDRPVEVQVLYPTLGTAAPLAAVADAYGLDREALEAATQAALAAPDRVVEVRVGQVAAQPGSGSV